MRGSESTLTLVQRVQAGDTSALEVLYTRYLNPLQRWTRGRLPPWARGVLDTDDIVQETLLRSLHSIERFVPERSGAFHAYLLRAVSNRIRDEIRRAGRRPSSDLSVGVIADRAPSPLEAAIGKDMLSRYRQALDTLSPGDQDAVIARVELGFSYAEVAGLLEKPSPDAARMAVTRALVRLATAMADAEIV